MKKIAFFFLICINISAFSQSNDWGIALIPQPMSLTKQRGSFVLPEQLTIHTAKNDELKRLAAGLAERISRATGKNVVLNETPDPRTNGIQLSLSTDKSIPNEGYVLDVTTTHVSLEASDPSGIFYGIQTLLQLLPKEIESKSKFEK